MPPKPYVLTEDLMPGVIERYQAGESSVQIGRDLNIKAATICDFLERKGITRRTLRASHLRHACDERYFQRIDAEPKAYWLGFLAADGGVNGPRLALILARRDRSHLERFAAALRTDYPVTDFSAKGFPRSRIGLWCPPLVADLAAQGVTPRKTFDLRWPQLPADLLRHYLRGYMDGDGGFYRYPRQRRPTHSVSYLMSFAITSNVEFLAGARSFLMTTCSLPETRLNFCPRNRAIAALRWGGRLQVGRIFDLLYRDATVWLPRKREKIEPHL